MNAQTAEEDGLLACRLVREGLRGDPDPISMDATLLLGVTARLAGFAAEILADYAQVTGTDPEALLDQYLLMSLEGMVR